MPRRIGSHGCLRPVASRLQAAAGLREADLLNTAPPCVSLPANPPVTRNARRAPTYTRRPHGCSHTQWPGSHQLTRLYRVHRTRRGLRLASAATHEGRIQRSGLHNCVRNSGITAARLRPPARDCPLTDTSPVARGCAVHWPPSRRRCCCLLPNCAVQPCRLQRPCGASAAAQLWRDHAAPAAARGPAGDRVQCGGAPTHARLLAGPPRACGASAHSSSVREEPAGAHGRACPSRADAAIHSAPLFAARCKFPPDIPGSRGRSSRTT